MENMVSSKVDPLETQEINQDIYDSQMFRFQTTLEQSILMLDEIRQNKFKIFLFLSKIGNQISSFSKEENIEQLTDIIDKHKQFIELLQVYIIDSFETVLSLRYNQIIQYYLRNGYELENNKDAMFQLIYTSRFFKQELPIETFNLLIKYGIDLNQSDPQQSERTPLHLASKMGLYEYVEIILKQNIDPSPVDGNMKTPLYYAIKNNDQRIMEILKRYGGVEDWRSYMDDNKIQ